MTNMVEKGRPYVQTYSVIAGSLACNARCPYCVAKMTPSQGLEIKKPEINWRNFDLGANLSKKWGAATALITSKGEATLFPEQITQFMYQLKKHKFPMIELQTNGIKLMEDFYDTHLKDWYKLGMTTIAISMAHYDAKKNKKIYQPHNKNILDLPKLINKLHKMGFSVRLTCIIFKDYIDCIEEVKKLVNFAKENKVEQLTMTPVQKPLKSENEDVFNWTKQHQISKEKINEIREFLDKEGNRLRELVHGAIVFDYKGQNVCLNNCLTIKPETGSIRQIIFFPDGHIRYDWQHRGAILF